MSVEAVKVNNRACRDGDECAVVVAVMRSRYSAIERQLIGVFCRSWGTLGLDPGWKSFEPPEPDHRRSGIPSEEASACSEGVREEWIFLPVRGGNLCGREIHAAIDTREGSAPNGTGDHPTAVRNMRLITREDESRFGTAEVPELPVPPSPRGSHAAHHKGNSMTAQGEKVRPPAASSAGSRRWGGWSHP